MSAMTRRRKRGRRKGGKKALRIELLLGLLILLALAGYELWSVSHGIVEYDYGGKQFSISFIDVGQGDSTLITSNGESMLVDAGERDQAQNILDELRRQGVSEITYLAATHPHSDHIGGMAEILNSMPVKHILMPDREHTTRTFENLLDTIDELGHEITIAKQGLELTLGAAEISVLSPKEGAEFSNLNNYSLVIRVQYGNSSFLLMGDAEREIETQLIDYPIKSTVLKVGHHGSASSSVAEFLDAVNPDYAIISYGENNDYDHPSDIVVQRLLERGITILTTFEKGTITMSADEGGVYEVHN
jgi:beta-lactamase superfamily II metal-dependent hydrolase